MSVTTNPFQPMGSATNTNHVQGTTAGVTVAISPAPVAGDQVGQNVRISATAAVFIALGASAAAAAVTIAAAGTPGNGIYLGAGQSIVLPVANGTHVGARTSTGTSEVYVTRGDGGA